MIWSISESRTFRRCQRQWYFKDVLASPTSKDPIRHTVYLLGKLQSISAWRGSIVDTVISQTILPAVRSRRTIRLDQARGHAQQIFDRQLAFARRHPLHEPGLSPAKLGADFAAFYEMEYSGSVDNGEVERAWVEIERSLTNLFGMRELATELKSAAYVIGQRTLTVPHSGMTVRAVPDAVAFFDAAPPLIIDWKVHAFGLKDAWTQLATYAIALMNCIPHKDFPATLGRWHVKDVRLAEAQLLTNQVRRFTLTDHDVDRANAHIAQSVTEMLLAIGDRERGQLQATDFPVAADPDVCRRCPFRRLCWEETS